MEKRQFAALAWLLLPARRDRPAAIVRVVPIGLRFWAELLPIETTKCKLQFQC